MWINEILNIIEITMAKWEKKKQILNIKIIRQI